MLILGVLLIFWTFWLLLSVMPGVILGCLARFRVFGGRLFRFGGGSGWLRVRRGVVGRSLVLRRRRFLGRLGFLCILVHLRFVRVEGVLG